MRYVITIATLGVLLNFVGSTKSYVDQLPQATVAKEQTPTVRLVPKKQTFAKQEDIILRIVVENRTDRKMWDISLDIVNPHIDVALKNLAFDFRGTCVDLREPYKSGATVIHRFGTFDLDAREVSSTALNFNEFVGLVAPGKYRIPYTYRFSYEVANKADRTEVLAKGILVFTVAEE